ncbi:MAG: SdrD B-like domain-containing protein, partial [Cyanobacteria bacterium J06555_13]
RRLDIDIESSQPSAEPLQSQISASSTLGLFPAAYGLESFPSQASTANAALSPASLVANGIDLSILSFDVTRDHLLLGETDLTFTLTNQGGVAAEAFKVDVLYSNDSQLGNDDDIVIRTVDVVRVDPGDPLTRTVTVQLPLDVLNTRALSDDLPEAGLDYISKSTDFLGLRIDSTNSIAETNEENNINSIKGRGLDDVTYFPWDIDDNGLITPTDAAFAINRIGQSRTADNALADFDGNQLITPTDAIAAINRIGYRINPEVVTPNIDAALANDDGLDATDRITSDVTLEGVVADVTQVEIFQAKFKNAPKTSFTDITDELLGDGRFNLSPEQLNDIYGGSLPFGKHTITFQATNTAGNDAKPFNLEFTLDPLTSEIQGIKWEDIDANGALNGIETGLPDVTIYLDTNKNGQLDENEPSQLTDETGAYRFTGLASGSYQVREVLPVGYAQTFPLAQPVNSGDGYADVVLEYFAAGNSPSPLAEPYGSTGGSPSPTAENGLYTIESVDPDVILGAPPPSPIVSSNSAVDWLALPKDSYVTVGFTDERIVDGPGDDILIRSFDPADSANEFADVFVSADGLSFKKLGTVNERGSVSLDLADIGFVQPVSAVRVVGLDNLGSSPGFDLVSVEALSGSTSSPDFHTVAVAPGDTAKDINFGNKLPTGEIRGEKWEDKNGNGIKEGTEPGLEGVTIYLDEDKDGQFDPDELSQITDSNGSYRFRDLAAGDYTVREVIPVDFASTFPEKSAYGITLGLGEIVDDIDFGNQQLSQLTVENRPPEFTSSPVVVATEGAEYSYQPTATDPDNDSLTFSLVSGPEGLTIESETGLLLWTPKATQIQSTPITIQVSDGSGATATQTFSIEVQARTTNNAPVFISEPITDFAVAVPNTATGDVNPELIALSLAEGETRTESVSITLPTGGGTSTGGQADVVFVVDESGSMDTEHEWLTTMVLELESALQSRGITDNRYSLVGYTAQSRLFNLAAQTQVSVYGPGNQLVGSGDFGAVINNLELEFDLLADGTYTVVISPSGTEVPVEYSLNTSITESSIVPLTNLNTPFSGAVAAEAEETFAFEAPAGTQVIFDGLASSSVSNIRARLIDSSGNTVFSGVRLSSDTTPYLLPESGAYSLVVNGGDTGGDFSFQL